MGIRDQIINLSVDKDESLDDGIIKVHVTVNRDVDLEDIQDVVDPIIQQGLDVDVEIPDDGNLIVPGVSIGAAKIGDSLERVRELYGEPTWEGDFNYSNQNPWEWADLWRFDWYDSRNEPIQISYLDLGLFIWCGSV